MTPEGTVKKAFVDEAKKRGLVYINLIATGEKGNPDKVCFPRYGDAVFVEFKAENGRLSEEQVSKIRLYRTLNYPVFVIDNKQDAKMIVRSLTSLPWYSTLTQDEVERRQACLNAI